LDAGVVDHEVDVVPQERIPERVRVHEEGRYDDYGEMPAGSPPARARGDRDARVAPPPHPRPARSRRGLPVGAASAPPNPGHGRRRSAAAPGVSRPTQGARLTIFNYRPIVAPILCAQNPEIPIGVARG